MACWSKVWKSVPVEFHAVIGEAENVTQKVCIRLNAGGSAIRVRLCNPGSEEPLKVESAFAGIVPGTAPGTMPETAPETMAPLTAQGKTSFAISSDTYFFSDPLPLQTQPGDAVCIEMYFRERSPIRTVEMTWSAGTWQASFSRENVFTFLGEDTEEKTAMAGFDTLEVLTEERPYTTALFGDSLTHMGYYYDALCEELLRESPGKMCVLNCALNGGQLLQDAGIRPDLPGNGSMYGPAGLRRFWRDVPDLSGLDCVFVWLGTNDLRSELHTEGTQPEAEEIAAGLLELKGRVKKQGKRFGTSLLPPLGTRQAQAQRSEEDRLRRRRVNELIQKSFPEEEILLLNQVLESPEDPDYSDPGMVLADGLHPGKAAGIQMALRLSEWLRK